MAYNAAALSAENLNNISDEQMTAFAQQFNTIEPGGVDPVNNSVIGTNFTQMMSVIDVISIACVVALAVYLSLPYLRQWSKKLSFIRS